MSPIRVGLVGIGEIARVQHIPTIAADDGFRLTAMASRSKPAVPDGVALFGSQEEMIASGLVDAVSLCTPPQVRYDFARKALLSGMHVMMEKPPAQTVAEVDDLARLAGTVGRTLFATWHSMFSGAVAPARRILAERGANAMRILWREDVHKFHPGVDWFWQPGGMGVFDPGVNALSIVVACLPEPVFVREARFRVMPGAHTPITAALELATPTHATGFSALFDWDHKGEETWSIDWTLEDGGLLALAGGGRSLVLDGRTVVDEPDREYPGLYRRFAELIQGGASDAETRPLQLAADAFSLARIERLPG